MRFELTLLLTVVIGLITNCTQAPGTNSFKTDELGRRIYVNQQLGIEFPIPEGWVVDVESPYQQRWRERMKREHPKFAELPPVLEFLDISEFGADAKVRFNPRLSLWAEDVAGFPWLTPESALTHTWDQGSYEIVKGPHPVKLGDHEWYRRDGSRRVRGVRVKMVEWVTRHRSHLVWIEIEADSAERLATLESIASGIVFRIDSLPSSDKDLEPPDQIGDQGLELIEEE